MGRLWNAVVQWGFKRLYHEFAWSYDVVAAVVSRGYWRRWIEAVLPLLQPGPTLELGCGTGYLQRALVGNGVHLGLDRSWPMLRLARRKVRAAGGVPQLVRGDAMLLPLTAGSIANVVATFPAPYILDPTMLREIKRVLEPNGQLLIVDNGVFVDHDMYSAAIDVAYRVTGQAHGDDPRPTLLQRAGFNVHERWVTVGRSQVWIAVATAAR